MCACACVSGVGRAVSLVSSWVWVADLLQHLISTLIQRFVGTCAPRLLAGLKTGGLMAANVCWRHAVRLG